jgi:hypothetical protein
MVGRRRDGRLLWAPPDAHLPGEANARRKRIRLPQEWYAVPGQTFFITICCHERRELFVEPRYAEPVFEALLRGRLARETDLSAACLMPDHLHVLVAPTETNCSARGSRTPRTFSMDWGCRGRCGSGASTTTPSVRVMVTPPNTR